MKKSKETELDFIIDKLTNSIENVVTGDTLHVLPLNSLINIFKTIKMKTKKIDLDVDFIGGQGSLTEAEEKELSEFFKQSKIKFKTDYKGSRPNKRPSITA